MVMPLLGMPIIIKVFWLMNMLNSYGTALASTSITRWKRENENIRQKGPHIGTFSIQSRALHWDWDPVANLAGTGGFKVCHGECNWDWLKKKVRLGEYKTKEKKENQIYGKTITNREGKELDFVRCNKCGKVLVYNGQKSGTSGLRRHNVPLY